MTIDFQIRGPYITLDAFVKATGHAQTGGHAKDLIKEGGVLVDGEREERRGRKLRGGELVKIGEAEYRLVADPNA